MGQRVSKGPNQKTENGGVQRDSLGFRQENRFSPILIICFLGLNKCVQLLGLTKGLRLQRRLLHLAFFFVALLLVPASESSLLSMATGTSIFFFPPTRRQGATDLRYNFHLLFRQGFWLLHVMILCPFLILTSNYCDYLRYFERKRR